MELDWFKSIEASISFWNSSEPYKSLRGARKIQDFHMVFMTYNYCLSFISSTPERVISTHIELTFGNCSRGQDSELCIFLWQDARFCPSFWRTLLQLFHKHLLLNGVELVQFHLLIPYPWEPSQSEASRHRSDIHHWIYNITSPQSLCLHYLFFFICLSACLSASITVLMHSILHI